MTIKVGIIGGSGLDNPELFKDPEDVLQPTIWGDPTSPLKIGKISGVSVVLLARHGRDHTFPPSQVNYRANIQALKDVGCTHILATTAVGSLRENIGRGDLVIIDQFIDFTKQRKMTFFESFEPHKPIHAPMAKPFDPILRKILEAGCLDQGIHFHKSGTVVTIEGPRFSSQAESKMFRALGADIINMSISTEVTLANEIGIPYAAIAMSTDYDCWKDGEEPVSWGEILQVFKANVDKVTKLLRFAIPMIAERK